jgi:integrase
MKRKLTDLTVTRMKPPATGRLEVWDATLPAFGLRVTSTGARSWVVALRRPGAKHPSRIKLGEPPVMSLADARRAARTMMQTDPPATPAEPDSVAMVVEQFIARDQKPKNRRWRDVQRMLNRELAPWFTRPITSITRRDVIELLDRTADRAPVRANRVLAHTRRMFGWALDRDIITASPVAGIRAPTREVARDRVLEPEELAAVWRACNGLGWPFGPLVQLLIVTGQRRDEVARMAWPDVNLERRLWTMPRELTKSDRLHEVPLPDLAVETIASLPRFGDGLLFPARRAGSVNPVSGFARIKARIDGLSGVTGWRLHDLRRTAASGMARLGHAPHVVSAILNHSPGATQGITAIYNRYRYTDEKRAALAAWGREIERIVAGKSAPVAGVTDYILTD